MNYLHNLREYVTPVLQTSNFQKQGVLTPQEFVEAGDFLVYKCPTWEWSGGVKGKKRSYLKDPNKQYLVTKNVPCRVRCNQSEYKQAGDESGWTVYEDALTKPEPVNIENEINDEEDEEDQKSQSTTKSKEECVDEDIKGQETCSDSEYVLAEDGESDEEDTAVYNENDGIIKTRTYDLYITYDNYYRTPRVWLFGYDENGRHLTENEIFEDVAPSHAKQTVTYEMHPHENYMAMSIHPCKHASTMKKLIKRYTSGGSGEDDDSTDGKAKQEKKQDKPPLRPDQYLCMFLKFIGTVIPTITYDFSMSM